MTVATWPQHGKTNWDGLLQGYMADQFPPRVNPVQHAPALNMWFPEAEGAKADGTTDDAAAINAAIVKASAAGNGARVVLAAGKTYAIGSRISAKANVRIEGAATIKLLGSCTTQAILVQNVSAVRMSDFTIDLNRADPTTNPTGTANGGATTNQQGILVSATTVPMFIIKISNVAVKNGWQRGIAAASANASFSISDLTVDDCTISTVGDVGIFVSCVGNTDRVTPSTSQRIKVRGNTITGDGKGGIQVIGCSYVDVLNNTLDGTGSAGHGIAFSTSGATGQVTDFTCSGNKVKNYTGTGKWGILASNNCKRFTIASNPGVVGNTGGISIDPEDSANLGVIVDVAATVFANTVSGSLNGHGINSRICKNLAISGNSSSGNNGSGIVVSNGYGCTVSSNTANGNAAYGVSIVGTNAGTGGHTVGPNATVDNVIGSVHTDATPVACAFATTSSVPA